MSLVQISGNTIVDKDKVYALVGSEYDGKLYTRVYMNAGNEDKVFLVEKNVIDVGASLMKENDDWKC